MNKYTVLLLDENDETCSRWIEAESGEDALMEIARDVRGGEMRLIGALEGEVMLAATGSDEHNRLVSADDYAGEDE